MSEAREALDVDNERFAYRIEVFGWLRRAEEGRVLDTYFDSGTKNMVISEVKVEREAKTMATVLFSSRFIVFSMKKLTP